MRKTVDIMGIPVDNVTMREAVAKVKDFLSEDKVHVIYTPNSEIMMAAQRDDTLKNILIEADMLVADGAGVVLASKVLGSRLPEKVSGIDLVKNTFSISMDKKIKYFFLGGKPGIAEAAKENILKDHLGIEICGCLNGYFSISEEKEILNQINTSEIDILLIALGAPKQEKWIHEHKNKLNVKICIGIGGSLDIFAGKTKLAPEFFRRNGLEWLYRFYKEPWRFKRMLNLPKFMLLALKLRILRT